MKKKNKPSNPNVRGKREITSSMAKLLHGDNLGQYHPYANFRGYKVTAENRGELLSYLMESNNWTRERASEELNIHKKMFKAYLEGKRTFRHKGDIYNVDTDIHRTKEAAEKVFPIVKTDK